MKRQRFIIDSSLPVQQVLSHINKLPTDGTIEVIIQEHNDSRHLAQNSLYWRWLDALVEQTGFGTEELHDRFKVTYMLPIYLMEPETNEQKEWVSLYDMIKEDGTPEMRERMVKTISTRMATVPQFKDYMDKVSAFCMSKGFRLPQ